MAGLTPASTVLILRDGPSAPEVFMVRRHDRVAFMGGAHVFPGGRVEAADRDVADDRWCDGLGHAAAQLAELPPPDAVAFHVAAIRELFEEAGILLARDQTGRFVPLSSADADGRFGKYRVDVETGRRTIRDVVEREHLRLAFDALVLWAHWVTPPIETRRFDTRFFAAAAPADQIPAHGEGETTEGGWFTASDALARAVAGELLLPPPTWTTLRELEQATSVDAALRAARQRHVTRREPELIERDGRMMLVVPGDPLHSHGGAEPPAPETRFVLVDGRWRSERGRT